MSKTVDFGAPPEFGMHHFYVEIPAAPRDAIVICEDYGFDGDESRRETVERRLILARELWTKIRDDARRDFNARLKMKKQGSGNWSTGKVKLDRFLGRELCVLGWAAEHASPDECLIICQKWLALRPEERWWLYSKTAAEAGRDDQTQRGWRKALYCALSDGAKIKLEIQKKPKSKKLPIEDDPQDLFGFMEKGEF
ncbi:DUF3780 domain-containing protein [Atlantibacter hermannii]|uniref:anti-phage-associated DUF3780 domain-containing protein n=1 Tax=Atlantibacter hermannii TaxID=565 RepID=UPI0028AAA00E|nr:anti-phage-associated DUF3780 domain-containing protein [Atlantibacter hermannii]